MYEQRIGEHFTSRNTKAANAEMGQGPQHHAYGIPAERSIGIGERETLRTVRTILDLLKHERAKNQRQSCA